MYKCTKAKSTKVQYEGKNWVGMTLVQCSTINYTFYCTNESPDGNSNNSLNGLFFRYDWL